MCVVIWCSAVLCRLCAKKHMCAKCRIRSIYKKDYFIFAPNPAFAPNPMNVARI